MIPDLRRTYLSVAIICLLSLLPSSRDKCTSCVKASSFNVGDESFDSHEEKIYEEKISATDKRSRHQDMTHHDSVDEFYSFSLDDTSLMAALFPDMNRLRDAWEVHPLLSKVSFDTNTQSKPVPLNSIPTIFHNRTTTLQYNGHVTAGTDPIMSLLSVKDTLQILPHLHHPTDFKVVKTITKSNGNEVVDGIKPGMIQTVNEVIHHFNNDGRSLVMYEMQKRWSAVNRMTRVLEEELGNKLINVNLYMTPEVRRKGDRHQGVGAHWDVKDVIIVQLAGVKRWSVAREPNIYLAGRSNNVQPTQAEVQYYADKNQYLEFTLCPGDVLYIPRGHLHNASTVDASQIKRKWVDFDVCPDYQSDLQEATPLKRVVHEPSMHVTFSLESDTTIEGLMHYALHDYFARGPGRNKNSVVIPAGYCSSPYQEVMSHDVRMKSVLHHALAEVARRQNDCDNPSSRGISAKPRRECGATLRRLVPFLLLENNELRDIRSLNMNKQVDLRILKKEYHKALTMFRDLASIPKTVAFIRGLIEDGIDTEGAEGIRCPDGLNSVSDGTFSAILEDFVQFSLSTFYNTLIRMNVDAKRGREREWQLQESERVGQAL